MRKVNRGMEGWKKVWLTAWISCIAGLGLCQEQDSLSLKHRFNLALKLKFENQDKSIELSQACKKGFLQQGDTLLAIRSLINLSSLRISEANYGKAYDGFWEAQLLAKQLADSTYTGEIYDNIALLYSLYGKNKLALTYFQKAIVLKKQQVAQTIKPASSLISTYYLLAIFYRELANYQTAKQYLDSCKQIKRNEHKQHEESVFFKAEMAYIENHLGNYQKAEEILLEITPTFQQINKGYFVVLYSFLGDVYMNMNKLDQSETCYLFAIESHKKYNGHRNYVPIIFEKLSDLYFKQKKYQKAHRYLKMAKQMNDELFGVKSNNNNGLVEIKDEFRASQEKQKQLLSQAKLTALEHEKRIWWLKNMVLLAVLAVVVLLSVGIVLYIRYRHKSEQKILKEHHELNKLKNSEILEIKNKELTTFALRLIEKDELLHDIKCQLSAHKNADKKLEVDSIVSKIKTNSKQDWKEFNARFTSVNEKFYEALRAKFPSLTQSELKLCALIKLNFSSKEMVSLLGISLESVHTARYRLRKKFGLERSDNLVEFIARI